MIQNVAFCFLEHAQISLKLGSLLSWEIKWCDPDTMKTAQKKGLTLYFPSKKFRKVGGAFLTLNLLHCITATLDIYLSNVWINYTYTFKVFIKKEECTSILWS